MSKPPPESVVFGGRYSRGSLQKGKGGLPLQKSGKCHYCGKLGHYKAQCRTRMADEAAKPQTQPQTQHKKVQRVVNVAFTAIDSSEADQHPKDGQQWFVDSGASTHLTSNVLVLENYSLFPDDEEHTLRWGDGMYSQAAGEGTVRVRDSNGNVTMTLHNVWHVPEAKVGLVSVSQATKESGVTFAFNNDCCTISQDGKKVLSAPVQENKLYGFTSHSAPPDSRLQRHKQAREMRRRHMLELEAVVNPRLAAVATTIIPADPTLWHRRLGHTSYSTLSKLQAGGLVTGITAEAADFKAAPVSCESCVMGKHTKLPFTSSERESKEPLELVHTDLCQQPTEAVTGKKYMLTLYDDYSKYSEIVYLREKSEAKTELPKMITAWENQQGKRVKTLRSDNGREYLNEVLGEYLDSKGIKHELSVPYTPEQNGAAERLNRTLLETTRTLLHEAGMPQEWWAEACNTANYMRNRTTITKKGKTPYELFHGKVPDLSAARVFGCKAYPYVDGARRTKLDPTSKHGTMVGYSPNRKAYRILVDGEVIENRDVHFNETYMPWARGAPVPDYDQPAAPVAAPSAEAAGVGGSGQGNEQPLAAATPAPEQQPTAAAPAPTQEPAAGPAAPEEQPRLRRSARHSASQQQQEPAPDSAADAAERSSRTRYTLRDNPRSREHSSYMAEPQYATHGPPRGNTRR